MNVSNELFYAFGFYETFYHESLMLVRGDEIYPIGLSNICQILANLILSEENMRIISSGISFVASFPE